jgi:hypothetical protein
MPAARLLVTVIRQDGTEYSDILPEKKDKW